MNLVLFEPSEIDAPLAGDDPRTRHIFTVLRRREDEPFDAGIVNGPIGKATARLLPDGNVQIAFTPVREAPPPPPVTLLIGLPRPQTARDILRDATTLGVERIHFITTERADPNYATSSLWASGEWRRHCLAGAAQAFDTRIPGVTWTHSLATAIEALSSDSRRFALDNYEATTALTAADSTASPQSGRGVVGALGPERGWGASDRAALRAAGFTLVHLGQRVLRVETAVIAALTLLRSA